MANFYDTIPADIRELSNRDAVARYAAGATVPAAAIAGLTDAQLNAFPVPGTWSIKQIVVHLMDADLVASYRMKRMIAQNNPKLDMWDEVAFSQRLSYDKLNIADVAATFRLNRLITADILRQLPDDAFARTAQHPENGQIALGQLVRVYIHHLNHHMAFLEKKRAIVAG